MKRISALIAIVTLMAAPSAMAQEVNNYGYFDHLGAGVSVGLDGIGVDLAAPIGNYFQLRAGVSFMPSIKVFDTDITYKYGKINPDTGRKPEATVGVDFKALGWTNGKLLFDYYPSIKNDFRITAGLFIGSSAIIKAYNTDPIKSDGEGIEVGNVPLQAENGNAKIHLRTNAIKPYVGIGYGRDVPRSRVNFGADLGVMIWGKPGLSAWGKNADTGKPEWVDFDKDDLDNKDFTENYDKYEKYLWPVYPVLSIRVGFRLF